MADPIIFYFDFSSPYGFLASQKVSALGRLIGRDILWRPYLIGAVYQAYGGAPLEHPLKKAYMLADFERSARFAGLPNARFPDNFPASSVIPSRVYYWIEREAPEKAGAFVEAAYRAYWLDGHDVADKATALNIASTLGIDFNSVNNGIQEQEIKDRLRHETEDAVANGVFGSPFIRIGTESFWGFDRFTQISQSYSVP